MTTDTPSNVRSELSRGAIIAGVILVLAVALKLVHALGLGRDMASRVIGVASGLIVVCNANAIPKALTPLSQTTCDPARVQAVRRFVAWSLVLGGLAFMGAWIFAPSTRDAVISAGCLGTSLLLVIGRISWARLRARWVG